MNHAVENPILRKNNQTFFADICVEYEDWLKNHGKGNFKIDGVDYVSFENHDDAMDFVNKFWKETLK